MSRTDPQSGQTSNDTDRPSPRSVHGSQDCWHGPAIELLGLSRWFGDTHAVRSVSFSVPRGNVFGFIGPNGAGKTTSMRVLATLDIPNDGDARVEGISSVNDPDRVRNRLGFMPDSFGTYRNTNCAEYLDFYARSHGLVGRQRTARMRRVMDFTGLRALADKPIRGLSKGMKQRLCLGRALIHDPAVLILDEPAAGLDPRARIELRRMIRELASDDKTILISSHILTELAEMCDRIGIIEQGQLLATGTVDEVRGNTTQTRHIAIEFAGPANELKQLLDAPADIAAGLIEDVTIKDNWAKFRFKGDRDDQTKLLQEIIRTEMPVLQFRCEDQSLEDVFLSVTKGLVQ